MLASKLQRFFSVDVVIDYRLSSPPITTLHWCATIAPVCYVSLIDIGHVHVCRCRLLGIIQRSILPSDLQHERISVHGRCLRNISVA